MRATARRAYYDDWLDTNDDLPPSSSMTVFEEDFDGEWRPSGLLDESGSPIMVYDPPSRDPIGFLWHDESGNLRPRDELFSEMI